MKKMIKIHYGVISSQNRLEKAKKEKKIKIIVSFRPYPTSNRKFQKNKKKIKKLKNTVMASFQSKICRRRPRKRENENYCSESLLPNP